MKPKLERKLRLLEQAVTWVVIGVVLTAFIVAASRIGAAADPIGPQVRGYTFTGILLGVLALLFMVATMLYSLRKRALQERLGAGGTMMTWLWMHVVFGLSAVVLVALHAGFGAISPRWSTGKIVLLCFVVVALSGVLWRLAYRVVPRSVAHKVGNYSEQDALHRAETRLTEITKLTAGKSAAFRQWAEMLMARPGAQPVQLAHGATADELAVLAEIQTLAASRKRALDRAKLMRRAVRRMQWWRAFHVPVSLLLFGALVVHVVGALELIPRMSSLGTVPVGQLSGFESADACEPCHARAVEQWRHSMHAHAFGSPITQVQNNLFVRSLPDDTPGELRRLCINCHGPLGAALANGDFLPLERAGYDSDLLNEGVGCVTCHSHKKGRDAGSPALAAWQDELEPGTIFFGPYDDPVGNAYHRSKRIELYDEPERLCLGCHNVTFDKNDDGKIERGIDLVLQTTDEEYEEYREDGGTASCVDCHMPRLKEDDAADSARLYFDQDSVAPKRVVRDHSFAGVDLPLGNAAARKTHEKKRQALLGRAAALRIPEDAIKRKGDEVAFTVEIENVGAGHNLPSGFAFARQMWLEVKVKDRKGRVVFESGVLDEPSDDLCDAATMDDDDNPAAQFMVGCKKSDKQLVNFQQQLFNKVQILKDDDGEPVTNDDGEFLIEPARGGREAWIQSLDGGVVPRVRPFDKKPTLVIPPGEERKFGYLAKGKRLDGGTIEVRLLFRNLPPYFVRAMANDQKKSDGPDLSQYVDELDVVEMAREKEDIP